MSVGNVPRILVIVEVVLCFALPAYFLFWGLITLPMWISGATNGAGFAAIHVLSTLGGCLGIWAVIKALRFYLARRAAAAPNWTVIAACGLIGIASIWIELTGQFAGFELDWFSVLSIIAPTLCAIHIFYLAIRKPTPTGIERARPMLDETV